MNKSNNNGWGYAENNSKKKVEGEILSIRYIHVMFALVCVTQDYSYHQKLDTRRTLLHEDQGCSLIIKGAEIWGKFGKCTLLNVCGHAMNRGVIGTLWVWKWGMPRAMSTAWD